MEMVDVVHAVHVLCHSHRAPAASTTDDDLHDGSSSSSKSVNPLSYDTYMTAAHRRMILTPLPNGTAVTEHRRIRPCPKLPSSHLKPAIPAPRHHVDALAGSFASSLRPQSRLPGALFLPA
ncbi:hypothetical protein LIA77_01210 [Sarocladium implicatum]|nr:hypothetical protein LIA77_01210 [Sarocladium implicatum]